MPRPLITIPGNHDLPGHSLDNYEKSALGLIELITPAFINLNEEGVRISDNISIDGVPFGKLKEFKSKPKETNRRVLMIHELVFPKSLPSWVKGGFTSRDILEQFGNEYDVILVGDNHSGFVDELENDHGEISWLVNPGSMMRITTEQINYLPRCYSYSSDENEVREEFFPIEKDVYNIERAIQEKERDERIAAYIERMNVDWDISLSYKKNLEMFFNENKIPKKVRELIWQHLETEKI